MVRWYTFTWIWASIFLCPATALTNVRVSWYQKFSSPPRTWALSRKIRALSNLFSAQARLAWVSKVFASVLWSWSSWLCTVYILKRSKYQCNTCYLFILTITYHRHQGGLGEKLSGCLMKPHADTDLSFVHPNILSIHMPILWSRITHQSLPDILKC